MRAKANHQPPLLRLWDENHLPTTSVRLALHLGLEVVDVEG